MLGTSITNCHEPGFPASNIEDDIKISGAAGIDAENATIMSPDKLDLLGGTFGAATYIGPGTVECIC